MFPKNEIDRTDVEIQFEAVGTHTNLEAADWSTASLQHLSPNPKSRRLHLSGFDTTEANSLNYLNVRSYISPFDSKIWAASSYQLNSWQL